MKKSTLLIIFFVFSGIYSQSPQSHIDLAQKNLDQNLKFTAEFHALMSLSETIKNVKNNKELIQKAFEILNEINSNFRPNKEEMATHADSLKSSNLKLLKDNILPKILNSVFYEDDYFNFYETYLSRLYYDDDNQTVIEMHEQVSDILWKSKNKLKIEHLNHLNYVIKAYVSKNEVQKNIDLLALMQEIYENNGRTREDNFISVYLEVGDQYDEIDINSSLTFYDIALKRYQKLGESKDENILNEILESQSIAQLFSGKYKEALEIELENLKSLQPNNYKYLKAKLRILDLYYKTDDLNSIQKQIDEIRILIEKIDKQKDSYLINKVELSYILVENKDYKNAIKDLEELIVFLEKFRNDDFSTTNEIKFLLCKCLFYDNQINNAKKIADTINEKYLTDENFKEFDALKKNIDSNHFFLDSYFGSYSILKLILVLIFLFSLIFILKIRK